MMPRIENGELRMLAWPEENGEPRPILDILLELDAPDATIERYIHPMGTPEQWERWERIKANR